MKNFFFLAFIFVASSLYAQEGIKLSGKVVEADSQEPILGANIRLLNTNNGTTSDFDAGD